MAPDFAPWCGEVPTPIPGAYRTVEYEPTQHAPRLVATVQRQE